MAVDAPNAGEAPTPRIVSCPDLILVPGGYERAIRWRTGERLDQIFERQCAWMREHGHDDHLAVDTGEVTLTYAQLDARANQLARFLRAQGAQPGERIGLLFDEAVCSYVGMLAVLKINAAYVPLDVGFPPDRLAYIVEDARVRTVLSLSHLRERLGDVATNVVCVDADGARVAVESGQRLTDAEKGAPVDQLCYIIYTSGSTGRPKGVAVDHASICNFVHVAAEVYGLQPQDRVYQGMTIAFDFSVEEIWVPLAAGATLVPKPGGSSLLGADLREFLQANRVTALCCVPTLLATLDEDLPDLRFLLVSGEACPQHLIARWHRPDRRFLNVYGPTEATVTATWSVVDPDRPVTLGVPLPTYSVVILDPTEATALPPGQMGEIGIAGIGLARGYVNRDDLTDKAFIRDFLGIADNPSGRIYRTGDMGRVNDDGEIEYHGRIDSQVKIRGYRIELAEIESVLLQNHGIAQTVVNTYEPEPGMVELVAYYTLRDRTDSIDPDVVITELRERLPGYMVPAYLEELDTIPMLPSDKVDRKSLPPPKGPRPATRHHHVAPTTITESALAEALARVLHVERVSVDSHFFHDLGANSLLMARFCARVRERADLPSLSMRDVYAQPTIRDLAAALDLLEPATSEPPAAFEPVMRASTARYVTCGVLQFLVFVGYMYVSALVLAWSLRWVQGATGAVETYVRSVEVSGATFSFLCTAPILLKWVLVGRWKSREIPVWSLAYLRFWIVKTLVRSNPLVLFVGSPLYVLYLRGLGAKIGRDVVILSRTMPICTDLLTIGAGTVIRKDTFFLCYRAMAGVIQMGPVRLGRNVFIGEKTVLDIDTSMGDGAQLGHASALLRFQAVPDGEHWHGSPARATDIEYQTIGPARCGILRKVSYSTLQVLVPLLIYGPIGYSLVGGLLLDFFQTSPLVDVTSASAVGRLVVMSFAIYFGLVLAGLVFVTTIPRLLNLALKPDRVYPLYGLRYAVKRAVARLTNVKFYVDLFGDSAYIPYYLRSIGYRLGRIEQTGSNFGTELGHESPYLTTIGVGTMISDALSIMNAEHSSTSFRMSRVTIGAKNFLGNNIAYPVGAKVGDDCLLGTKVAVPLTGHIHTGVGLLGSPCFEIPRSVQSDGRFDHLRVGDEFSRRLAAKRRYNTVTMGLFLLVRWIRFAIAMLIAATVARYFTASSVAVGTVCLLVFTVSYGVFIERLVTRFRPLTPQFCSIYQPYFWWHERVWKLLASPLFNGTPYKNVIWRMLGVRIGHRVFDDGCGIPEKTMVTIGDDCTLNAGSIIQCHSLEDGTFKSDRTVIGAGCTLGVESFVHYGVSMATGSVLAADAFLMKGEEVASYTHWQGNPASEIVMGAKRPETRARRIAQAIDGLDAD